ncbi:MAG: NAD(P)/FAD-dependent oxidoreductase [Myxococcales bacterium]|nr:MAG: NAD(P)/FAD-dependent oxidoreductase [Myxococcales bacterium]
MKKLSLIFILASMLVACFSIKQQPIHRGQHFIVIGCSSAGYFAVKELEKLAPDSVITCIDQDADQSYKRTSLAALVSGKKTSSDIEMLPPISKEKIFFDGKVIAINRAQKKIILANKQEINYDKLLITTGTHPLAPAHLEHVFLLPNVVHFNSQGDVRAISKIISTKKRVLIVGTGLRSLELADALSHIKPPLTISLLARNNRFLGTKSDSRADKFIMQRALAKGINLINDGQIENIFRHVNDGLKVKMSDGSIIETDLVIFAIGNRPNSELAKAAGLALTKNNGIKTDTYLNTSDPHIFAAGDVASFIDPLSKEYIQSSKWLAAKEQGIVAAHNMLGQKKSYTLNPPSYASSFFELSIFTAGSVRENKFDNNSFIDVSPHHYFRVILKNQRIKAFIFLWEKNHKKPDILFIKNKFIAQSPIGMNELKEKLLNFAKK